MIPLAASKFLAGPFRDSRRLNPTPEGLTLERNPDWWSQDSKLETVTFSALEPESVHGYANSEIDAIDFLVDAASYRDRQGPPGR